VSTLLEVRGLLTSFPMESGRAAVVNGVDLRIERSEVAALVGESGCGKSVTALSILRLVPRPGRIEAGEVKLQGRDLLGLSVPEMRQVRGQDISMIFQEPMTSLNPVTPVGRQVIEAIRLHGKVDKAEARQRTLELFGRVGIPDPAERFDAYAHQLSGGMKQRVMIAMALASQPKLLIADEPTTALDVTIQAQILELPRELRDQLGMAILLITHDLGIVNELADRVCVMYAGRVVEEAARIEVLNDARHPYTEGLLRSLPARAKVGERLAEIPGMVPSPEQWPSGCPFSPRCPRVLPVCSELDPEASTLSATHWTRCHAVAKEQAA
jgi:oligopeptide/dipeptide ABC transporter ATP-binding protein